ncbi:hypothetical protein NLM59_05025 [Weeksellaceae bacterium KMM 9724]|uniref:hypothetical protein n=1 Tax=Profundicola chukchiensis TaxID=2961959 RepID=UPI0024386B76|nr:hypothetical protein [Profundicola chukchiensis]MDG4950276.1 hypothetical protein [Profundicola chukchiensis]
MSFAGNDVKIINEEIILSECCTRTVVNPETGESATATECATTRREACDAASVAANNKLYDFEVDSGNYDLD